MAYGTLLGHELVYGHHTNAEVTCHNHDTGCDDHHDSNSGHFPCLFNINPHFASNLDIVFVLQEDDNYKGLNQFLERPPLPLVHEACMEVPPDIRVPGFYSNPFNRIHGMRGPPLA